MDVAAFRSWLLDNARVPDELFCADLLLETAEDKLPRIQALGFAARNRMNDEKRRRRSLDPGYRPRISRQHIDECAPFFATVKRFAPGLSYNDRRVPDLSALRFFPQLESVDAYTQLRDLSGLVPLASLKQLSIHDDWLRDLSALRSLPNLERVSLWLQHPWPEPAGLESLSACTVIDLHLNLQILEGIPEWSQVKQVHLVKSSAPLRDLRKLPGMPLVEDMETDAAALDGIGRYPTLKKLKLRGVFEDLSPLAGLPCLRELVLNGERFEDLSPLARLPELRILELGRERGLVLDPLLEAPRLRFVQAPRCKVIATELASLNAAISWQREDFTIDPPPASPPLRVICYEPRHPETQAILAIIPPDERELFAPGETTLPKTESAWMRSLVEKTLTEHRGSGWGRVRNLGRGELYIAFFRKRELHAAWSLLELIRSLLARARFPWEATIVFDEEEENDWWPREGDDEDDYVYQPSPEQIEEDRQTARDHRAFLEREHQLRLGAQGLAVKSAEAEPDPEEPPPAEPEDENDDEDEAKETAYDPFDHLRVILSKEIVWVWTDSEDAARAILGRKPEDWHALPEPPERRPRPL